LVTIVPGAAHEGPLGVGAVIFADPPPVLQPGGVMVAHAVGTETEAHDVPQPVSL
jgi:hypothetical protein